MLHWFKSLNDPRFHRRQQDELIVKRCLRLWDSLSSCHTSVSPCVIYDPTKTCWSSKCHLGLHICLLIRILLDHWSDVHCSDFGEVRSKHGAIVCWRYSIVIASMLIVYRIVGICLLIRIFRLRNHWICSSSCVFHRGYGNKKKNSQ